MSPQRIASRRRARSGRGGEAPRLGALEDTKTTEQKIIRAKVGLPELAKQLGNVSQACKMMRYSRDNDDPSPLDGFVDATSHGEGFSG